MLNVRFITESCRLAAIRMNLIRLLHDFPECWPELAFSSAELARQFKGLDMTFVSLDTAALCGGA